MTESHAPILDFQWDLTGTRWHRSPNVWPDPAWTTPQAWAADLGRIFADSPDPDVRIPADAWTERLLSHYIMPTPPDGRFRLWAIREPDATNHVAVITVYAHPAAGDTLNNLAAELDPRPDVTGTPAHLTVYRTDHLGEGLKAIHLLADLDRTGAFTAWPAMTYGFHRDGFTLVVQATASVGSTLANLSDELDDLVRGITFTVTHPQP